MPYSLAFITPNTITYYVFIGITFISLVLCLICLIIVFFREKQEGQATSQGTKNNCASFPLCRMCPETSNLKCMSISPLKNSSAVPSFPKSETEVDNCCGSADKK